MRAASRSPAPRCSGPSPAASRVFQCDIDEGAGGLSRPGVRLRDPQPDAAGDAASAAGAARDAARGAARRSSRSRISATGGAALDAVQRPRAADRAVSVRVVRVAEHPLPDRARFRESGARGRAVVERRYFLAGHRKVELLPNLLTEVAVYLRLTTSQVDPFARTIRCAAKTLPAAVEPLRGVRDRRRQFDQVMADAGDEAASARPDSARVSSRADACVTDSSHGKSKTCRFHRRRAARARTGVVAARSAS